MRAPVDALMKVLTHGQYAEPAANTDTQARPISTTTAATETLTPDLVPDAGPQHAGRQARTPGDRVTVGVGRAEGVPVGLAHLRQPEATPAGTPWCKTSVAVSWRSGAMTGRGCQGRGSSARRVRW